MSERSPGARDLDTLVERAARLTAPEDFRRRVQSRLDDGGAWHTPRPRLASLVMAGAATAALVVALLGWTPWREQGTPPADVASSAGPGTDIDRTNLPRAEAGSTPPVASASSEQPHSARVATLASAEASGRANRRAGTAAAMVVDETGVGLALDVDAWTRLRPEPIHVAPIEVASFDDHEGLEVDPIHVTPIEIDRLAHPAPIVHTWSPPGPL